VKVAIAYFLFLPTFLTLSHFLGTLHTFWGFIVCAPAMAALALFLLINAVWVALHQKTSPALTSGEKKEFAIAIILGAVTLIGNGSGFDSLSNDCGRRTLNFHRMR
jgi:hypothetical protein